MKIADINRAADAYLAEAQGAAAARLEFLKGLWAVQADIAERAAAYSAPPVDAARDALATGQPLFLLSPPDVPADAYRAAIAQVIAYILESAALDESEAGALASANVPAAVTDEQVVSAVRDLDGFVTGVVAALGSGTDTGAPSQASVAFVLQSALVGFLVDASATSLEALGDYDWSIWGSGHCPVCGANAAMGRMSESTKLKGAARTLWCTQCHAEWGYERLRCVRCGSRIQDKLRYAYEESDPIHRLHLCDECHGYLKVTFEDAMDKPVSMPVEEAASITLDAAARAEGYTSTGIHA